MSSRDNGLEAANYSALTEIDPPLVQHALDLLNAAGIAAYVEPVEGERGPYLDVTLPDRIVMRLFVDRESIDSARTVLVQHLPGLRATFLADSAARSDRSDMAASEIDAAWTQIISGYDTPTAAVGPWSVAEDVDDHPVAIVESSKRSDPHDDPDDHFVPPPPPPLPESHPVTRLAWAGVIGGPTFLLLVSILGISLESWVILLAILAFCGGVATLVTRMNERAPQDDGWDDGAVV